MSVINRELQYLSKCSGLKERRCVGMAGMCMFVCMNGHFVQKTMNWELAGINRNLPSWYLSKALGWRTLQTFRDWQG